MNIKTLTTPKPCDNDYISACPSDDVGLLRYSSSQPNTFRHKSPVKYQSEIPKADLQAVITRYQGNPELLRLILSSKVEEDKRRTEEAKLKTKELDLYMKTQTSQLKPYSTNSDFETNRINSQLEPVTVLNRRRSSSSSTSSTNSSTAGGSTLRRIVPYSVPSSRTRPIAIDPQQRRNSSTSSLFAMNRLSIHNNNNAINQQTKLKPSSAPSPSHYLYTPASSALDCKNNMTPLPKARRRRSIQAITKVIETKEYPYHDGYFWKNNGNTTQKKTGCRNVYYKCTNSCKGCPVNKTVIEQPDGIYVIKYRGDHIPECNQVEHIKDL
ncbi:hypothetical protein K501DRAFT_323762 [Backusella circina FSU 941]|nr:hypothetical protein K501DRAFT_323762 [Backusella circina FSU 941]